MMHHPNMHHQPMSGHPPQHMPAHQGMPAHHQMPPHQMHRENRHVTLTRVPLGPGQAGGGLGAHGQLGGLGALAVPPHHAPAQRPPHAIRPMHHPAPHPQHPQHPQHPPHAQHHSHSHSVPPPARPMRRPYSVGGAYGPAGAGAVLPPYAQPPPAQPPPAAQPLHRAKPNAHNNNRMSAPPSASMSTGSSTTNVIAEKKVEEKATVDATQSASASAGAAGGGGATGGTGGGGEPRGEEEGGGGAAAGEDAARAPPAALAPANSKEKTPMCLVNELARYNKIKHQYRLTSETGPAHKKVFTVTLRLGDTEEYTAEGSSIKRAQHAAAAAALSGTRLTAPPPRAAPPHQPHHARHATAVMPTVELNALAMKLCQPALYASVPPLAAPRRARPPYRLPLLPPYPMRVLDDPHLLYRVRVTVGGRSWVGEGATPQGARHDAAARALADLRPPPDAPAPADAAAARHTDNDNGEGNNDLLNSEVKSPVSLVHELALKRNLSVQFTVKSERGPPHMRVFVTACTVGELETEGQGNGKKVSKRRAAERMLDEMRRRWPPAALRHRPPADRRRQHQPKKKPRNLIKEGAGGAESPGAGGGGGGGGGAANGAADNPISRLAVARHAARARSPQYRVLEERGAARRREFLVQCDAPPHSATGLGPNKKTAKRRAAHNVLLAMEMSANADGTAAGNSISESNTNGSCETNKNSNDIKRKENETGGTGNDIRQPVPGVLVMDYHQRSGQPTQPNGVSESSATGGAGGGGGSTPGAKDQLMYLSQLLGFTVQFSDFPKRNHGEYLSLVSLSTEPPVMCHGGGASTAHSHEQCARAALRALALMGLDAPTTGAGSGTLPGPGAKPNIITNGIAE